MAHAQKTRIYDGDEIEVNGLRFIVSLEADDNNEAPWERSTGHGPVSEWTTRDKRPGEWVVNTDGNSRRYYDAQEAMKMAKRDGWGLWGDQLKDLTAKLGRTPTAGEIRAHAVRIDFEFMQGWCNDNWHYIGVCVRHVSQDEDERYSHAVWAIESCAEDYIAETATQLAEQCGAEIMAEIETCKAAYTRYRTEARAIIKDMRELGYMGSAICSALREHLQTLRGQWQSMAERINELQGA